MLFRQADGLFKHTEVLREQLHHQVLATRRLDGNHTGGDPDAPGLKPGCSSPDCTGKDCRLVPGEDGCPRCSCGEVVKPLDEDTKGTLTDKPHHVQKRQDKKDESSEESKESDEQKSHSVKKRHDQDDSSEETDKENVGEVAVASLTTPRTASRSRRGSKHRSGLHGNDSSPRLGRQAEHGADVQNVTSQLHPAQVRCVMPVCEPYCAKRPAEHGCLVCDCPDVCPDIVCGAGCQPYFTETSKCERCVCNPHARRDLMADVFASYCSEPILHRMMADFGVLERMLHDLQQQSFQQQHLINRAEQLRGIHGPVSEELKALFARQQYERLHEHQQKHLAPLAHKSYETEERSKPHKGPKKHGGRRTKQDTTRSP